MKKIRAWKIFKKFIQNQISIKTKIKNKHPKKKD